MILKHITIWESQSRARNGNTPSGIRNKRGGGWNEFYLLRHEAEQVKMDFLFENVLSVLILFIKPKFRGVFTQ